MVEENQDATLITQFDESERHEEPDSQGVGIDEWMKLFGTISATSLQRVLPVQMCTGLDFSDQPLQGDYTDALFLSHRDTTHSALAERRRRRRMLESVFLPTSFLGQELIDELEKLKNADDAESEISEISIRNIHWLDGEGGDTVLPAGSSAAEIGNEGQACSDLCPMRWISPWDDDGVDHTVQTSTTFPPTDSGTDSVYASLSLGSFRVLELLNGPKHGLIQCKLHVVLLSESDTDITVHPPRYEALSYCWGPPEDSRFTIVCDNRLIEVQKNLYEALCHLRRTEQSRILWVDALCINQADVQERNSQVSIMLRIYQNAFRVLVWLGEGTQGNGELAMWFLQAIDDVECRRDILHRSHSSYCLANLPRAYNAAQELFARPWFRRAWIRQELAVGRKVRVLCGTQSISWAQLKRSWRRLIGAVKEKLSKDMSSQLTDSTTYDTIQYLKRGWSYGQSVEGVVGVAGSLHYWHGGGLLDLLFTGREFEATDARDKIYAILGLAREPLTAHDQNAIYPYLEPGEEFEPMKIDYDAPVSEVYQYLVKYVINKDLNLDIICYAQCPRTRTSSTLPSWTPDWRVASMPRPAGYNLLFMAGSYTRAEKQDQKELGNLTLKTYHVDTITALHPFTAGAWDFLYEKAEAIMASPGEAENKKNLTGEPIILAYDSEHHTTRCCFTKTGRFVLAPSTAAINDEIHIALGSKMPFTLRRKSDKSKDSDTQDQNSSDSKQFEFVGVALHPCYMQGEVFSKHDNSEVQTITLI